jgi:chloramphenicol-sensitive protein RarD
MNKGILAGIGAYMLWGVFPIYWKFLHEVPALQIIGHRIAWSFVLLALYVFITGQWREFRSAAFRWRTIGIYSLAAVLLSINWLIYIWGVNAGLIVETSLGYFINPLLSILLGVIFLREHLRSWQWVPVALATAGVIYLTIAYGRLPWIALSLAFTFGIYGFVKKLAPLSSLHGLTLETGIIFPMALCYLGFVSLSGAGAFSHQGLWTDLLLAGTGLVTTIPLLMFASAAKQIPLTLVGLLQYIAPTMQFLIGVLLYKEPFDVAHLIGFGFVWVALIVFAIENYVARRVALQPMPEMGED